MNLNEYQQKAKTTDERPKKWAMVCNGFGLIGESHELQEIAHLHDSDKIIKEAGDVMWYTAMFAEGLGEELESVSRRKMRTPSRNFSEVNKKVYRDNDGIFNGDYKEDILDHLRNVIEYVSTLYDIDKIMKKNIEKLFSRKERGVIKGDGNDR